MKLETLVNKYIRLGYTPIGFVAVDNDLDSIISWLWNTYKIFVSISYIPNWIASPDPKRKFYSRVNFTKTHDESCIVTDEAHFKDPYECKFETLKGLHKVLMFSPEYLKKDSEV